MLATMVLDEVRSDATAPLPVVLVYEPVLQPSPGILGRPVNLQPSSLARRSTTTWSIRFRRARPQLVHHR